jgi:squalene synthase HpnC
VKQLLPNETDSVMSAYRECERIARRHYENFPVASLILPRKLRKHVAAIYAFARVADDFADQPGVTDRLGLLADWEARLRRCPDGGESHPVFRALGQTIQILDLPMQYFIDLLNAFRHDVTTKRHQRFEDLLAYSRCSANPIGRLLLLLFGYRDEDLGRQSDSVCTALQLTNFWQDIAIDWEKGRVYLPVEEMKEFGYPEKDLENQVVNAAYRTLMASLIERTRALFNEGRLLGHRLRGRLGLEVRMIWLGGTTILDRIEAVDYDVFRRRPQLRLGDKITILAQALGGGPSPDRPV